MIYPKLRFHLTTALAGFALIGILGGCSAKSASSTSQIPTLDTSLFQDNSGLTSGSLPPGLFDGTYQDPAPTTNSSTYQPITSVENQCLTNDMSFFGGLTSMDSYYYGQPTTQCAQPSTQNFWDTSISMMAAQDFCLQQAIMMIPSTTSSQTDIGAAGQAAEAMLIRCLRYQYNRAANYTTYNPAQQQVYQTGDYGMYMMLQPYGH